MGHTCSHQPKLSALLGRLMLITPWWYINVDWFSFASWSTKSPFNHFPIYPKRRAAVFNKATGMRYSGPRVITRRLQDWLDISQQHSLFQSLALPSWLRVCYERLSWSQIWNWPLRRAARTRIIFLPPAIRNIWNYIQ